MVFVQNPTTIALGVAVVCAGVQYMYIKNNMVAEDPFSPPASPPLSNTMYVFMASFGLVYLIIYGIQDERAAAISEMEVGEPDF
jgi:hypothetical protein